MVEFHNTLQNNYTTTALDNRTKLTELEYALGPPSSTARPPRES